MERPPMETALSTDVIMDTIMSHLKVRDLLACRQVSKCWNKAASSVLRKRTTLIKNISEENHLVELQECMEANLDFPFAGLKFDKPWRLNSAGAMEFFNNYGARFTRLRLYAHLTIRLQDLVPFIHLLPHLATLELGWRHSEPPDVEVLDPADSKILDLSSVRTIRIWSRCAHQVNEDVLRQVFQAACSSQLRIECPEATYEFLRALKSVGKLQAISVMNVEERGQNNALRMDELLWTETPALTALVFQNGRCFSRNGLIRLLTASQHTLKKLCLIGICPSEVLSECPVLPKLSELHVWTFDDCEYVFQGRHGYRFPALQELTLGIGLNPSTANLSDGLFIVPSLKKIHLLTNVDKAGMEDLARSFPNVVQIRLEALEWSEGRDLFDLGSVGAFKFLDKLRIWDFVVKRPTKNFINMDSFLTGMSVGICQNLRKHPQQNLKDSPFNEILRDSPNLLQLKNLKELIVCVKLEDGLEELSDDAPFISMVSVWYALQMMPKLTVKFVYEHSSPSQRSQGEQRDKAVTLLKDAFKLVQPHVELEPFFY